MSDEHHPRFAPAPGPVADIEDVVADVQPDDHPGGGGLDQQVSGGDIRLAEAAVPAKDDPAQQWDVVVPFDRAAAVGTVGWGEDDALTARQPVDHHVEKAAHARPDHQ